MRAGPTQKRGGEGYTRAGSHTEGRRGGVHEGWPPHRGEEGRGARGLARTQRGGGEGHTRAGPTQRGGGEGYMRAGPHTEGRRGGVHKGWLPHRGEEGRGT